MWVPCCNFAESHLDTARCPSVALGKVKFLAGGDGDHKARWLFLCDSCRDRQTGHN